MPELRNIRFPGAELKLCDESKIPLPEQNPNGTYDQILRTNGDGTTRWDNAASQEEIGNAVEGWLEENVTSGETLIVDNSLTISGAAADAKVTGDEIHELKSTLRTVGDLDLIAGGARNNGTNKDVTFAWNADKTACTVHGTNSSDSVYAANYLFGDNNTIPDGIIPGETYLVSVASTSEQVRLGFYFYIDGVYASYKTFFADGTVTIPADATGVLVFVGLRPGQTATNDVISGLALQKANFAAIESDLNRKISAFSADATTLVATAQSQIDLNDPAYLNPGNYAVRTAESSNNILHGPITGYGYHLLVFQTTADSRVFQIAFINSVSPSNISELKIAVRNYTGTWSEWQYMAGTAAVADVMEIAKAAITTKSSERTVIPDGTDYDSLTTTGNYYVATRASVATMTNVPYGIGNHVLCVIGGPASSTIHQIIYDNYSNIYVRTKLNKNTTFTKWQLLAKMDALNGQVGDEWEQGRVLNNGTLATVSYAIRKKIIVGSASTVWAYDLNVADSITRTVSAYYFNDSDEMLSRAVVSSDHSIPSDAVYMYVVVMAGSTTATVETDYGKNVLVFLDNKTETQTLLNDLTNNYAALSVKQATIIPEGTDYNTLVNSGTYRFTENVTTLTNVPDGVGRHFLWVLQGTTYATIHQFILDNNGVIYYRMRLNASSDFSDWEVARKSVQSEEIDYPVEWALSKVGFSEFGSLEASPSTAYKISKPIKLYAGDVVDFHAYFTAKRIAMMPFADRWDRFWASTVGKSTGIMSATESKTQTLTTTVPKTGYYVFSGSISETSYLKIKRNYRQIELVEENEKLSAWNYGSAKHNVVDDTDAIPDMSSRGAISVTAYAGDNKVNSNHIVNAVAYPDGTIIACRAKSGQVVKIDNDGTETVLMTIANAKDWRGLFMDSNLNVYTSPHSTYASPAMARTDRGLYRLAYGESTFERVINLCRSTTDIIKWQAETQYQVGTIVFEDYTSAFYACKTAHTSASTFDEDFESGYWDTFAEWAPLTPYNANDIVVYNDLYFRCAENHTSGSAFDYSKWNAATEYMSNDDTIWTMCEDEIGYLYAGCYAHGDRTNAAIYTSHDGGETWFYQHNFKMNGTLPNSNYGQNGIRHVHCINFNPYDNTLYAAVGEVNTLCKSTDRGETWEDMHVQCHYGQPTYVMGVRDGLLIGSDGHYACGISKLLTDGTMKRCGRTVPGFIFNIRRSDVTGFLYAWTRTDNILDSVAECPPMNCIDNQSNLDDWKTDMAENHPQSLQYWENHHEFASKYYPEDAIRPTHSVIMVSRDDGDTWEVFYKVQTSVNSAGYTGFVTCGYFRDGEILAGLLTSSNNPNDGDYQTSFINPIIISEGKKKHTADGYDLSGEIFIKTNTSNIVGY